MSIKGIINKIKKLDNNYLYERIYDYISKINYELKKYDKNCEKVIFDKIKNKIIEENKNIKIDTITINDIYKYFEEYGKLFQKKNETKDLINILKNLLFTNIDNNVQSNFNDLYDENKFILNDFIYNYTLEAIDNKLFDKNQIKNESINYLYNIYLYLIFKVEEPIIITKLKILIYEKLYDVKKSNSSIKDFVKSSLEKIFNKNTDDNKTLIENQKKYGEFSNIEKIKKVSDNIINFFKSNREDNDNIFKFFTINNIKKNSEKIDKKDNKNNNCDDKIKFKEIEQKDIEVDNLKYDEKKIFFFSTEFLIVNGFKSNLEDNDFELFNEDNYGVDIFIKFINDIIPNINESIKTNNFLNDYIKDKLIQIHKEKLIHYMSARLDYDYKVHLNQLDKSKKKNETLKIIIYIYLLQKWKEKEKEKQKMKTCQHHYQ